MWHYVMFNTGFILLCVVCLWLLSLKIRDASIIDMFWGAGFGCIALICLGLNAKDRYITAYMVLLASLPILWAIRYTVYIVWRNWGHGEDNRYASVRAKIPPKKYPLYSLVFIFIAQAGAMLLVAVPVIAGLAHARASITPIKEFAIIGAAIWFIGFFFETLSDYQLAKFIENRASQDGKNIYSVMDKGLWRYSRHPNYFGNSLMWWGIGIVALQNHQLWWVLIGPLFMTFALTKLTGVAHLEKTMAQRPQYREYMQTTSAFIPWFPKKST